MTFAPGVSGNPAGRPPGSRNRATLLREAAFEDRSLALAEQMFDQAEAGSLPAARLAFSRVARPVRTARFDPVPVRTIHDVPDAIGAVLAAIAAGDITPQEGDIITRLIQAQANAILDSRDERLREEKERRWREEEAERLADAEDAPPAALEKEQVETSGPRPAPASAPVAEPPAAPVRTVYVAGLPPGAQLVGRAIASGAADCPPGRLPVRISGGLLSQAAAGSGGGGPGGDSA